MPFRLSLSKPCESIFSGHDLPRSQPAPDVYLGDVVPGGILGASDVDHLLCGGTISAMGLLKI